MPGVRHLPVMDTNRCRGLVSESDVIRAVAVGDRRPGGKLARPARLVRHLDRRSVAARAMAETGGDTVLVVDDDRVLGIVTAPTSPAR